ncbi:MAG: hypothetical protein U9P44_00365 [archaeon]|nr:hypothetical protein [archaeon]
MSSTDNKYKISGGMLSSGSGLSEGAPYKLSLTIGQTVSGASASRNYNLLLGSLFYEGDIDIHFCNYPQSLWRWMDISKEGTDTIDNNSLNGLCCGDDENEYYIGSDNKPDQIADGTDACCPRPDDCVRFNSCIPTEIITSDARDNNDDSCYNTGTYQGFCKKNPTGNGSKWITDPDDSPDICCCLSSGYWDHIEKCCDSGDDWMSSDNRWTCHESNAIGTYTGQLCDSSLKPLISDITEPFPCNEMEIEGTKKWWNGTEWISPAPEYCGCTQNSDCNTENDESCIENICVAIKEPVFIFDKSITIPIGEIKEFMLNIANNMDITDKIEVKITETETISNWAWFKGQKSIKPHSKTISIPPHSSKKIIIDIMGGKTGTYNLNIYGQSLLTFKDKSIDSQIKIISYSINEKTGQIETAETPGLSWVGLLIITAITSLILYRKI